MSKKAAFITVHGMGAKIDNEYDAKLLTLLGKNKALKSRLPEVHLGKVMYQGILQPNEERVWALLKGQVDWHDLRKFLLFGFADATGIESNKSGRQSIYWQVQMRIARALLDARKAMGGDGLVTILAQSLGCQVISCFFWDANQEWDYGRRPADGIWSDMEVAQAELGVQLTPEELNFLRGAHFVKFITTGCNIPVFIAAHAQQDIIAIKPNEQFEWLNLYDKDDVLGWPLQNLYSLPAGLKLADLQVNASGGLLKTLLKSWNPLSHGEYWEDKDVVKQVAAKILETLPA